MKKQKYRFFCLIIFIVLLLGCANPKPEPIPTEVALNLNHQFRVYDSETQDSIFDAKVTIEKSDGTLPEIKRTDNEGYAIFDIKNSELVGKVGRLRVEANGYKPFIQNFTIAGDSLPTDIPLAPLDAAACDFNVNIVQSRDRLVSGEQTSFVVEASGSNLEYSWEADRGSFNTNNAALVEYIAPIEAGTVTITATVTNPTCGVTDSDEIEIMIISPAETPTFTPSPTLTPTASLTPTQCPVGSYEIIVEPMSLFVGETAVVTIELDENESIISWEAADGELIETGIGEAEYTAPSAPGEYQLSLSIENECGERINIVEGIQVMPTSSLVNTPTSPSVESIPQPEITHYEVLPYSALTLTWDWEEELNEEQNFAVRFWSVADSRPEARFSITWTKEKAYQFSIAGYPPGEYYMNVAVMIGPSVGEHYEVVRSQDVKVYVPPVDPTLPSDDE